MTDVQHVTEQEHRREKQRRRRAEAQVERLKMQVEHYQTEFQLCQQGVRYQLGDALVRAAKPSLDTLKLPVRLAQLLLRGLQQRRMRRNEATRRRAESAPTAADRQTDTVGVPEFPPLYAGHVLTPPYTNVDPGLRRRPDLRIAAITDEFSWRAWQFEADLCAFTPQTWQAEFAKRRPDMLLVESAWSGVGDSWSFQIRDLGGHPEVIRHYALPDIVAWCRKHDVPTVFYNKEDPPNFDVFIDTAKLFDFVFTSDENCIPDYRKCVGHSRVHALPFAAQPRIHNPVQTGPRDGSVCFAGTWYAHRHFGRHDDAERILRPGLEFDLHIFDRMANSGDENYHWPTAFLGAVRGALPYAQMLAAYKYYKVFLNINSVKNSPTMFSRRVFELLACGTPVISGYSEGIEELLGPDVVLMSDDEATTRELLTEVLEDDEYRQQLALRGQRKVLSEHTYAHRLQTILTTIGLPAEPVGRPTLTMIAAIEDSEQLAATWKSYRHQTYSDKRLFLCAPRAAALENVDRLTDGDTSVCPVVTADATWGTALQNAVAACADGFVAALNPASNYGPDYLTDYANATQYILEPAIGKATFCRNTAGGEQQSVNPGYEYQVCAAVNPWTLCLPRDTALKSSAELAGVSSPEEFWQGLAQRHQHIYSADRFNYT